MMWVLNLLGLKVGMERGPSPLLSIVKVCQHTPELPNVLGWYRTQLEPIWAGRGFGKLGRGEWGGARMEPSLRGVGMVCWPLEDQSW